jgi:aspartate/methionine/tyrosine aminotransferase
MISRRSQHWISEEPHLVRAHFACKRDAFDAKSNPTGYVNFGTAENQVIFDALEPLLRHATEIREADAHYNELHGALFLRQEIATFLQARAGRPLNAENIALASGASAVLEMLAFTVCDAGDAILIPTPYYPGFDHDLALRPETHLYPVPLAGPQFELRLTDIERAHAACVQEGRNVAAVLLNSPHNPSGQVYDESLIRDVVAFASHHEIHVLSDELYAESLLPNARHFSALRIQSPLVHVVYGFAKDFGLSGWKLGILHSDNPQVMDVARSTAYFYSVSMVTQRILSGVLGDPLLKEYFPALRARLAHIHREVTGELSSKRIPYTTAQGGIVLWLDLRAFLSAQSFEGERHLCQEIFDRCKVNISPGAAFHCSEPGWFRLCYTLPEAERREGLRRLTSFLAS